jgi:hypothetical protein
MKHHACYAEHVGVFLLMWDKHRDGDATDAVAAVQSFLLWINAGCSRECKALALADVVGERGAELREGALPRS